MLPVRSQGPKVHIVHMSSVGVYMGGYLSSSLKSQFRSADMPGMGVGPMFSGTVFLVSVPSFPSSVIDSSVLTTVPIVIGALKKGRVRCQDS